MKALDYEETQKLLKKYKINTSEALITKGVNIKQAGSIAEEIGFPVAVKIISRDIIHKTEFGAVSTDLKTKEEVEKAAEKMINLIRKKHKKARLQNILVQKMQAGREVIIGLKQDLQFGPVVMFGIGGVIVEIVGDVVFRIAPVNYDQAMEMISRIKSYKLLKGFRGEKQVNFTAIAELITKVSNIGIKNPEIKEIDFNPVFVDSKEAVVADARIMVE